MQNNWAYDPFEDAPEIADECDFCGAMIDDDTELYFHGEWGHPGHAAFIGCEDCVISMGAREAQDKGYMILTEYRTNPATGMKEKVEEN